MGATEPQVPPPPEIIPLIERLALEAVSVLEDEPDQLLAGVLHERGTLEWKQVRLMVEQATGRECTDRWVSALLDRPSVFDLLRRGGGPESLARLEAMIDRPGRWLPLIAIPRAGPFWTMAIELP